MGAHSKDSRGVCSALVCICLHIVMNFWDMERGGLKSRD